METIFLAIALLALARVPSLEALRYQPPGEWGRLLGLAQEWMAAEPESAGTLDVDGHVRVYHGKLTPWPRRYVARQRSACGGPPITGSTRWTGSGSLW